MTNNDTNNAVFTVTTQTVENYGAHESAGTFESGTNFWKFKGGRTFVVKGLRRMADAVAFVSSFLDNTVSAKEFVVQFHEGAADEDWPYVELTVAAFMAASPRERGRMLANQVTPKGWR